MGSESDDKRWLAEIAAAAAAEAHVPTELLGEYLTILSAAARSGRRPLPAELRAVRRLGRRAAEHGVDAGRAVDLYLSAAWRLWREMPMPTEHDVRSAADAVFRVVNDAVEAMVEGHQAARREMIRREESVRREFVDDLLRGDGDIARLVQRAEPFGLDLGRSHRVILAGLAGPSRARGTVDAATTGLERAVVERYGDREVIVATKDEMIVAIIPEAPGFDPGGADPRGSDQPNQLVHDHLSRHTTYRWQVAAGRPYAGAYGIARSYEEAREALLLARRLHRDAATVHPRDLLLYRVLGRDQAALVDLVQAVLDPLTRARGGAEPLLRTLETYVETGAVATETARRLHLSVRTVTYRLARIAALTGVDPADPVQRFTLQVAVLGARLLDWPARRSTG